MDVSSDIQKFMNEVEYRFAQADGVDFNLAEISGGVRLFWRDRNQDISYALTVSPNGWEFTSPEAGVTDRGFEFPPSMEDIVSAWSKIYSSWLDEHEDEYVTPDTNGFTSTTDPGRLLARKEAADYPPDHLDEFYIERNIPGDKQRLVAEQGAQALWQKMMSLGSICRANGINFERIGDVRYAGADDHIDRAKLYFRVPILAGPHPQRRATLSLVLSVRDGEVESPISFIDASGKTRILSEESLVAYLNFSESSSNRHRPVKTERSLIDRTLLPSPPAHSMFRHVTQDTSWRNIHPQK